MCLMRQQIFLMTADTGDVCDGSQGFAIVLFGVPVTVTAGSLLSLGIKKLFGGRIVFVVASLAFFTLRFAVAVMQRVAHTDGLPRRHHPRLSDMAFTANNRSAFLFCSGSLSVTANAIVMIDVHHRLPASIFKTHVFVGSHIFFRQMAGSTVFILALQYFGVFLVQKEDRTPIQPSEFFH